MKRLLTLFLAAGFLFSCNNKDNKDTGKSSSREKDSYFNEGNDKDEKDGRDRENNEASWSSSDIRKFNSDCEESLKETPGMADKLCPCLLEKFQKRYSDYSEMDAKSTAAEGEKAAKDCASDLGLNPNNAGNDDGNNRTAGGGWSAKDEDEFLSSCVKNAMAKGQTRSISTRYCECMLGKIESRYPNSADAANLTEDEINGIIARYRDGCLEE